MECVIEDTKSQVFIVDLIDRHLYWALSTPKGQSNLMFITIHDIKIMQNYVKILNTTLIICFSLALKMGVSS